MLADGDGAVDVDAAFLEGVEAVVKVGGAEVAAAEGALEAGVRAALFDATQADVVSLVDTIQVAEVVGEVVALGAALLAGADGFVALEEVGVLGAKGATAVLADVAGMVLAAAEEPSDLAGPRQFTIHDVRFPIAGWRLPSEQDESASARANFMDRWWQGAKARSTIRKSCEMRVASCDSADPEAGAGAVGGLEGRGEGPVRAAEDLDGVGFV